MNENFLKHSIYFHFLSILFIFRQACAIESAALTNPNRDIFVLFASPVAYNNKTKLPILEALLSYSNVNLRNVDLWKYTEGTPAQQWFIDGKLFQSRYMVSHVSDFLRYLRYNFFVTFGNVKIR